MVDGTNAFVYCRNQPISESDPSGTTSEPTDEVLDFPEDTIIGYPCSDARSTCNIDEATLGQHVDAFEGEDVYDPNYRAENGKHSEWLRLRYGDDVSIDININEINESGGVGWAEGIRDARVGEGGIVFPSELNTQTTPRLVEEKKKALQAMRDDSEVMLLALFAVLDLVSHRPAIRPTIPKAKLQPYGGPGGGHHVPAKAAFAGAPRYDANAALAIPNAELKRLGVAHSAVSGAQQTAYRAFAQTGQPLTWKVVEKIETAALVRGGMTRDMASATVKKAIDALKQAGVTGPTRIPWGT